MNKEKNVVDAVNCLCGNLTLENSMFCNSGEDVVATRCGDYLTLKSTGYISWGVICTIEEFNQCVKEMSLHNVTQEKLDAYVAADKEVLKAVKKISLARKYRNKIKNQKVAINDLQRKIDKMNTINQITAGPDSQTQAASRSFVVDWVEPPMVADIGFFEWKNGDECVYNGNSNCFVIGWLPSSPMIVIETNEMEIEAVMLGDISRPETQEQKYARERIASGIRLWRAINYNDTVSDERIIKLERFKDYIKAIDDGFADKKDS